MNDEGPSIVYFGPLRTRTDVYASLYNGTIGAPVLIDREANAAMVKTLKSNLRKDSPAFRRTRIVSEQRSGLFENAHCRAMVWLKRKFCNYSLRTRRNRSRSVVDESIWYASWNKALKVQRSWSWHETRSRKTTKTLQTQEDLHSSLNFRPI